MLGCPACSRTVFADTLGRPYPKHDIDLDDLYHFLDCAAGRDFDTLNLCGDYGDCIYYPKLIDLIDRFRDQKRFIIHTAGSHQTEKFWGELLSRVTDQDLIVFGIDGLESTNHLYRRRSDWSSIMRAVDLAVKSPARVRWDTNIFNFNYLQLDEIREYALNKGCEFSAKKTSRFGDDALRPPEQLIDTQALFQEEYNSDVIELEPQCRTQRTISASGLLRPCGWITAPLTYYRSQLRKEEQLWRIRGKTMDDLLEVLNTWAERIEQDPQAADVICRMKCKPGQVPTVYYE
jgi:MoaA/NifB/PqqE/SkfB family radical SAM enzyme